MRVRVESGPRHRVLDGERLRLAAGFEPGQEQTDLPFHFRELEPQGPTHRQVLVQAFAQRHHRGTCPNGTTSSRNEARSTFA